MSENKMQKCRTNWFLQGAYKIREIWNSIDNLKFSPAEYIFRLKKARQKNSSVFEI